jgi:hypothetical protein
VVLVSAAILAGTAGDYGITDDEPAYLRVETRLAGWFEQAGGGHLREALARPSIAEGWVFARQENRNLPAPALLSLLGRHLAPPWVSPLVASRLGHCLLMAVTLGALFGTLAVQRGFLCAGAATVALFAMPQAFAHAHLNATDGPASCFLMLTLLFWSQCRGRVGPALAAGIVCGLGLASKASLFFAPGLLLGGIILFREWSRLRAWGIVVGVALAVLFGVCPMWWHAPVEGFWDFVGASFGHSRDIWTFDSFYLGRVYLGSLPWHNGLILPLVSTPPLTLALAGLGAFRGLARRDPEAVLWVVAAGLLPALRMLPGAPGHDGVRLMLPSLFCLAPLAGLGVAEAFPRARGSVALGGLALVGLLEVGLLHPFEISYYSEVVGGLPGARRLGFEVSYWFDAMTPKAIREIQDRLPLGAVVWTYPSYPGYRALRDWGMWRSDLSSGERGADYLVLYTRRASIEVRPDVRRIYEGETPVWSLQCEGVQLVGLYRLSPEGSSRLSPHNPRSASRSAGMRRAASGASEGGRATGFP